MLTLNKDKTNRKLGKRPQVCRICGAEGEFDTYLVREMMQGTKDEFHYFACDRCQCLQITDVPENLGEYYGKNYYSFQVSAQSDMEFDKPVLHKEKILDVGCGGGAWLLQQAMEGWGNLYGCDPFLEQDRHYGQRVSIRSCSIHEMDGDQTFDMIRMSDSFEHMTDPLEVLKSVRRLLKPDGILYMSIPTYPNIAFEKFETHWYQLDAPRHIFLHSKKSLAWLAQVSGMMISNIRYDSNDSQFIRSYFYQHGIPFFEQNQLVSQYFSEKDIERLKNEAVIWNKKEYGDHMDVYWQKAPVWNPTFDEAIPLCSYLKAGEEEQALEWLEGISLESVKNRYAIFVEGFVSEEAIYNTLCAKLTAIQWEEWSEEILDAFTLSLTKENQYHQQANRFPNLLAQISVSSIILWIERSKEKRKGKIGECLYQYAMKCSIEKNPVQELCLCAWILREAYVKKRKKPDSREILYQYISVFGTFAERYYNPEYLIDATNHTIPPDICAVYRMAVVLADGTANSENVAILKQALEIFPPFHEEIRSILMELRSTEISRNN